MMSETQARIDVLHSMAASLADSLHNLVQDIVCDCNIGTNSQIDLIQDVLTAKRMVTDAAFILKDWTGDK